MNKWFVVGAVGLLAIACSSSSSSTGAGDSTGNNGGQRDQWTPDEAPERLLPGATVTLADIISEGDKGQDFGVDDDHVPYPDTYWPFTEEGIHAKWNGGDASPLDK